MVKSPARLSPSAGRSISIPASSPLSWTTKLRESEVVFRPASTASSSRLYQPGVSALTSTRCENTPAGGSPAESSGLGRRVLQGPDAVLHRGEAQSVRRPAVDEQASGDTVAVLDRGQRQLGSRVVDGDQGGVQRLRARLVDHLDLDRVGAVFQEGRVQRVAPLLRAFGPVEGVAVVKGDSDRPDAVLVLRGAFEQDVPAHGLADLGPRKGGHRFRRGHDKGHRGRFARHSADVLRRDLDACARCRPATPGPGEWKSSPALRS